MAQPDSGLADQPTVPSHAPRTRVQPCRHGCHLSRPPCCSDPAIENLSPNIIRVPTGVGNARIAPGALPRLTPHRPSHIIRSILQRTLPAAGIFPANRNNGGNRVPGRQQFPNQRAGRNSASTTSSAASSQCSDTVSRTDRAELRYLDVERRQRSDGQNTFGNPSYSGVIHTTYAISPTLLNEVAFNYNGNRINIIPQGLIALPSDFTSPPLHGPNNDNRIPKSISVAARVRNTTSWPWVNKADDYQVRDDVSWTKGAHQIKMGGSWAIYKKVQDLFGQTQGGFNFNTKLHGHGLRRFPSRRTPAATPNSLCRIMASGTTIPGRCISRTTGASTSG